VSSFDDLDRHFGALPPATVSALIAIAEAKGRADLYRQQGPSSLETLRRVALIQSTEASNAIENIHAPRPRIEELVTEKTTPQDRSEQEIAGYRDVLATIHANGAAIPFETRYVLQLHGSMHRYVGTRDAGKWKTVDNTVEEELPDGTRVVRFVPVPALLTPHAMEDLHAAFGRALSDGTYAPLLLVAAYVLDFTVIHPFRDGNGRMSRLITLWLLYVAGHDVGRYISLEKLIDDTKETYYDALRSSTKGWQEGTHDLAPWTGYFLGILLAAYREFERRTGVLAGRGSKRKLIETFIASRIVEEFTIADVREAAPGVSHGYINRVLGDLKNQGRVEPLGTGRSARWRRLGRFGNTS
jgi:Fic family protein